MKLPKAVSDYMATLGSKGGKTKGKSKARDPEHYRRLADLKRAKAKGSAKKRSNK
jgi:hypothetical protein